MITDDLVVLLEKTLQKNEEMITENQKLREEMKAKDEEHNRVLREVLNELQNIRQKHDDVGNRVRPQRQGKKRENSGIFSMSGEYILLYVILIRSSGQ